MYIKASVFTHAHLHFCLSKHFATCIFISRLAFDGAIFKKKTAGEGSERAPPLDLAVYHILVQPVAFGV